MASPDTSLPQILLRVHALLNGPERRKSAWLFVLIFVNSFVEIVGLAVVVPVISLVVRPETIATHPQLQYLFALTSRVGIDTHPRFLIALCFVMIGAFLFKATFGLAVNLFQTRFSFAVAHRLSGAMWTYHFSQSLERMRSKDSGQVIAEINTWPVLFASTFMVGGLLLLSELVIIGLIAGGLLWYNPVVFISIGLLLAIGTLIIRRISRRRLTAYSDIRRQLEPHTTTLINNAVRGFLEVITFRASDSVRDAYLKDRWTIFRINSNTTVLNFAPAKLYEVLAVAAVASSIVLTLLQGTPEAGFLELLSLMALSAYRIMPSMSRLNGVAMQLRGNMYVLHAIEEGGRWLHPSQFHETPADDLLHKAQVSIRLSGLTLGYAGKAHPVLSGLDAEFLPGRMHGIVGPSGAGKSTLVSALLGLHAPEVGRIEIQMNPGTATHVLGIDLDLHRWLLHTAYLSQHPFLFQGTVKDNLTLRVPGARLNEPLVNHLLGRLGLRECLGPAPLDFLLQEGGSNLSGGQQQRLALLRALQIERPVLILDEATSSLDMSLRDAVFALLRERADSGCTVILVTHDTALADRCDEVLRLGDVTDPNR